MIKNITTRKPLLEIKPTILAQKNLTKNKIDHTVAVTCIYNMRHHVTFIRVRKKISFP